MRAPVSQDCWALSQIAAFGKGEGFVPVTDSRPAAHHWEKFQNKEISLPKGMSFATLCCNCLVFEEKVDLS